MSATKKISYLKIIAGRFRGRRIEFPNTEAIRPTPNRVRETLFNWWMKLVSGAHCLDAFSGSGALAFEALSRDAASVVAIEKNVMFANQIQQNALKLGVENLEVMRGDFFTFHKQLSCIRETGFNLIFLDPPFYQNLLIPALTQLIKNNLLAEEHCIYFEVEKNFDLTALPESFEILKNQVAGQVRYGLLTADV